MILILFVTNTLQLQRTLKVFAVQSLLWPFSLTDLSTNVWSKWSKISIWETLKNPQGHSEKVQLLKQPEGCILERWGRAMIMVTGGGRIDSAFPTKAWWLNHPVQMSRKADKEPQLNDNTNFLSPRTSLLPLCLQWTTVSKQSPKDTVRWQAHKMKGVKCLWHCLPV